MIYDISPMQKAIMKAPHYIGHLSQWKPIYRQMPQLQALHINSTRSTWKTCTYCYGSKRNIADRMGTGLLEEMRCNICGGKGQIFVNEEGG